MIIRHLGLQSYIDTWEQMKAFTIARDISTPDECWLLEHYPVYTQGQAGKAHHILSPGSIPVVQTDRGGQVTYHGPGQLVVYFLIDLRRRQMGIRSFVNLLEDVLIKLIAEYGIQAERIAKAPGVYIHNKKIASLGLRVKNGCTYHGIALNVDMDLTPFKGINPCGISQLEMIQLKDFNSTLKINDVANQFENILLTFLK